MSRCFVATTTYSDEVQAQQRQKTTQFKYENSTQASKLHFSDLQYIYISIMPHTYATVN